MVAVATKTALVSEITRLLREFSQRWKTDLTPHLADLGLSLPSMWVLGALEGEVPMSAVAERLGVDPSYVTALADQLESRGLVERRADPADRRVRLLALTESGRDLRERLDQLLESTSPAANLRRSDLESLARLLRSALAP